MQKIDFKIAVLSLHRDRLAASKTFEEYRDVHVAYVDTLIAEFENDKKQEQIWMDYVNWKPEDK